MCAQSHALGTHSKIHLKILTLNVISGIVYFHKIISGFHKNLRKKLHDFSMTSPGQNPNFQKKK